MHARRSFKVLAALAALAAGAAGALGPATMAQADGYTDPTMNLPRHMGITPGVGPHSPYVQEIQISTVIPLKNQAIVNRTAYGYLFRAGQQNSHLKMTTSNGRLRFVDTGTRSWKWLPKGCSRLRLAHGVGARCRIPAKYSTAHPMLVEVWPRLGNDVVDSRRLSARFDVSFLGDKGRDVAHFGPGGDFFNGAQDNDKGYGGGGRDWIRTGLGSDVIYGGAGGDHLVGVGNNDVIYGGAGGDRLGGDDGSDKLYAGGGKDFVVCGSGADHAWAQASDRAVGCERLSRR